ncbi:MAG TPA: hypothetical protein VGY58_16640 [Gemmataceae bacterium]|nr:hypothetical protein [Gemmataceae bacterium]
MGEVTSQAGPAIAARRRPWFILGVLLFVLGPALYIVQFKLKHLGLVPWYVPLLATLGVAVMVLSVAQRRGILRTVGLALFALLCAGEWFVLLVVAKTPAYTGPVRPGEKLPAFAASFAGDSSFTEKDLEGGQRTALVFFRGRW